MKPPRPQRRPTNISEVPPDDSFYKFNTSELEQLNSSLPLKQTSFLATSAPPAKMTSSVTVSSMPDVTSPLLAIGLVVCMWLYKRHQEARNVKKYGSAVAGPTGFSSLKAFLSGAINNDLHIFAGDCAKRYGDVFKVSMGGQSTVFLNHPRTVRKLFGHQDLKRLTNDRPPTFIGKYITFDTHNTAFTNRTPVQQHRRKVFHSVMKFYGDNIWRIEGIIVDVLGQLKEQIRNKTQVDMSTIIEETVLNIIHILLAGQECSEDHIDALRHFNKKWEECFVFEIETVLQVFPFLRFIPGLPFKSKYEALKEARDELLGFYFHDMKVTYQKDKERGIIDYLFTQQKKLQDTGDFATVTDETIKASVCETTAASYISSASTVNILFLLLLRHSDIQERMYEEVCKMEDDVDAVSVKHRSQMPYIEAAILETLRYSTISPFLLPHFTRKDLTFEDQHVPKNSVLVMNAWFCHRRADIWPEPWTFNPERFLDDEGQLLHSDHPVRLNMVPFGAGARQCPAEAFARSRIFLIVANLVKSFQFYKLEEFPLPSEDPRDWPDGNLAKLPGDYKCGVRLR